MKVAVATDGRAVAAHFERCPMFTIADVTSGKVSGLTLTNNPGYALNALVDFLAAKHVGTLIVGNMEGINRQIFSQKGIKVMVGVSGNVEVALAKFSVSASAGIKSAGSAGVTYDIIKHEELPDQQESDEDKEKKDQSR